MAVSAAAAIALFWAVLFAVVLIDQGPAVTRAAAGSSDAGGGVKVTDIASGLIALFALVVATGSLWLTRRHYRLSVRPKVSIVRVIHDHGGAKKGFYLRNDGLGPALIDEISFEIKNGPALRSYENLLMFLFANDKYYFNQGQLGVRWIEVLPKDVCERLLWLESKESNAGDQFMHLLADLRLVVKYGSFYGEKEVELYDPMKPSKVAPLDPMDLFIDPKV
jgi:hypothetical protein